MANTQDTLGACARPVQHNRPDPAASRAARDTAVYLAHTQGGESMRAIAAASGTHPSTVLRAVRRVEDRRDDPLFDGLIEQAAQGPATGAGDPDDPCPELAAQTALHKAARSALRRLSEPGAFLLIAPEAVQGGIFCAANGHRKPIAMLPVAMAAEFVRREWIAVIGRGAASARYRITEPGRSALRRILAEDLAARGTDGFAEAQTGFEGQSPFQAQHALPGTRPLADPETGETAVLPVNLAESPLGWLARRRGADGQPFLSAAEVEAGERLRCDFEAAQMGPRVAQDWSRFLTPGEAGRSGPGRLPCEGPSAPRDRVSAALGCLGPGLSDIALRVCCLLEGIESCEKRLGWSARSGKVVLRLALQRLAEHYGLGRMRH